MTRSGWLLACVTVVVVAVAALAGCITVTVSSPAPTPALTLATASNPGCVQTTSGTLVAPPAAARSATHAVATARAHPTHTPRVVASHASHMSTRPAAGAHRQESAPPPCPAFVMPPLPVVPKAPLKELDAVSPGDTVAALAISEKHIIDLHHYIIRLQRTLDTAYQDYQRRCRLTPALSPTSTSVVPVAPSP